MYDSSHQSHYCHIDDENIGKTKPVVRNLRMSFCLLKLTERFIFISFVDV